MDFLHFCCLKLHCFCHCIGLTSVGVDVTFHDVEFVYGIPEHADSLALKSTAYGLFL